MYCPGCRESGRRPWDHAPDCTEGLKRMIRLYEIVIAALVVVVVLDTILPLFAFKLLGART